MLQFIPKEDFIPTFEIELEIKDSQGRPTGKRKTFSTSDPYKLSEFYLRHQGKPKKRHVKAASAKEATEVLSNDTELQQMYKQREEKMTQVEKENNEQT